MSHPSASGRSPTWLWRILGERIYGNFICWNEKSLLLVKEGNLQKRLLFCMHYISNVVPFSSVQFSRSVMSKSLQPHESQHARPPCPSPTPRVHSNSYPLSRWCHPAISSSVIPFSSCPQSSQHQGLFQWVNSSYEVAKVLDNIPIKCVFLSSAYRWVNWYHVCSECVKSLVS